MEKLWFVYSSEVVSGPFSTEQVKSDILNGKWTADAQIWWKGQKEWLAIDKWYHNLDTIMEANRKQGQQPIWYAERNGAQIGPLTKSDLVTELKKFDDVKNIRLWTVGLNHWTNLFEFHEIMSLLGISKRNYERAAIVGSVVVQRPGEALEKSLASVSGGGIGVKDCHNLVPGETVTVAIKSPLLVNPVRATAKVMYVEESGYAGLQFQTIHIEAKTTLMDYVKQFKHDHTPVTDGTIVRKVG